MPSKHLGAILDDAPKDRELPGGWMGGEVRHTGGGIFNREYVNDERNLKVVYDPRILSHGVSLSEFEWVDTEDYPEHREFAGTIKHIAPEGEGEDDPDEQDMIEEDRELNQIALGLMHAVEYGITDWEEDGEEYDSPVSDMVDLVTEFSNVAEEVDVFTLSEGDISVCSYIPEDDLDELQERAEEIPGDWEYHPSHEVGEYPDPQVAFRFDPEDDA